MHNASYSAMDKVLDLYREESARVLDVGSMDINGTFRPLVEMRGWKYTGIDLRWGKNVDAVPLSPYRYLYDDNTFDVVICGNTLHNVAEPWRLIPEMVRVLKPGGLLAIVTIHCWGENRHPQDYYRFMPDGLRHLFNLTGKLERYDINIISYHDIVGTAWKVSNG
jgi:SAM-dependent methyltransferase